MINILCLVLSTNPLSFRSMAGCCILHEKGATTTQAFHYEIQATTLGPECWYSFSFDISVTDHKLRMSSCPNGTPEHNWKVTKFDYWLQTPQRKQRKLLGWNPPHPDSTAVRKLQTRDSSEKTMVSQNSRGLLVISDPHCFLRWMLKGRRSGFLVALPRYPRAWR